jgi:DNA-binding response OmpR family regulator
VIVVIKIFAVDDDLHLLETIIIQIEQEGGYDIEGASSLKEAKAKLADVDPDLVILDVTLGDGDGRDFCRWMRDMGYTIPVLMLTAQSSEMDTIDGLEAGANDYIAKPVRMGELIARMKTHLIQHQAREDARITIGAFQFSSSRKTMVHIDSGEVINLTEKEAAIIKHLHLNRDKVVNKKALLEQVWGYGDGVTTHTLETHIYRLRQKIRYVDETDFLITSGGGYMLA